MSSYLAAVIALCEATDQQVVGSISPVPVPPNAVFPYVTVQQLLNDETQSLSGLSDLNRTAIQVNCWHQDYEVAFALRKNLRGGLMTSAGTTLMGLSIQAVNYLGDRDLHDDNRELHQLIARYAFWWEVP